MRYASATAFRTALETRLNAARTDAVGISRLRKRVVFERLLARLHEVAPGAWVLKGGFALELRLGAFARTTRDIDVDWKLEEEDAIGLLIDATALELDDGFEFALERASDDADLGGGRGQRWSVTANLAGRQFERVAIDVGFASEPVLEPETIVSSQLLAFAGVEPVHVPAVAIEQHVAEKLHAYTRTYAREKPSSRVKDLVDLVVIANTTKIDADRLRAAIEEIFGQRATHEAPPAVPAPPADWAAPWRRLVADLPADFDVDVGHGSAAAFLDPVLSGAVRLGEWDPDERAWMGA
jgi:predicted nucleotidyltransferase component of viral defense system